MFVEGKTGKQIAESLSVSPQIVSCWKQSPKFVSKLNNLKMEVLETARINLQQASGLAVTILIEIAKNTKSESLKRKTALDILRLTGFEPGKQDTYGWGVGARTVDHANIQLDRLDELFGPPDYD